MSDSRNVAAGSATAFPSWSAWMTYLYSEEHTLEHGRDSCDSRSRRENSCRSMRLLLLLVSRYLTVVAEQLIAGQQVAPAPIRCSRSAWRRLGSGTMVTNRGAYWAFVPSVMGMLLVAAGAADGHDVVVSGRDADWPLLIRADLELLGGLWLFSGRFPRGARIAAIITFVSILAYDVARMLAGYPARTLSARSPLRPGGSSLVICSSSRACCGGERGRHTRQGSTPIPADSLRHHSSRPRSVSRSTSRR